MQALELKRGTCRANTCIPIREQEMKHLPAVAILFSALCWFAPCNALAGPRPNVVANMPSIADARCAEAKEAQARKTALSMSGGGGAAESTELKDYGPEMSALFGNIRVP